MVRQDLDSVKDWSDAELQAAYDEVQNKDADWAPEERRAADIIKAEMDHRKNPQRLIRASRPGAAAVTYVPMVKPEVRKTETFEEQYRRLRQK